MNLKDIHTENKTLSAKSLAKSPQSKITAIQILKDGMLKEHVSKTPAILICVLGEVSYEDEKGINVLLNPGDFYEIEPMVKHWVKAMANSQLLLTN
jgi:quercetin dioxygenase-like cupin family protein